MWYGIECGYVLLHRMWYGIWPHVVYIECGYVECGYIECGYVECGYVECGYIECGYVECGMECGLCAYVLQSRITT